MPHHIRRFTEFSGDVSGRYIEALAVWARMKPAAPGPFSAPIANFMVRYLPGGYSLQPCTAMLRPIAEHTDEPDGNAVEWWMEERAQPAR